MDYKDYYRVLGVPKTADAETVKRAYRRLARRLHPDLNRDNPSAERQFKEVNEAYQVLGNPERRRKYDQLGRNWERIRQGGAGGGFSPPFDFGQPPGGQSRGKTSAGGNFSDFFRMFFGGFDPPSPGAQGRSPGGGPPPPPRPGHLTAELTVSVAEAVTGASRRVTINREAPCPRCDGRGEGCDPCGGRGRVVRPEDVEVAIPPGVHDGARLRKPGLGERSWDGRQRGDLFLTVRVRDDDHFRLQGRDVLVTIPVTLYEAVLGAEIDVPTPSGRVRMRIPPESAPQQVFRLSGRGLPALGRHPAGDQLVRIRIEMPRGLTPRQKELFQELARLDSARPRR